MKSLLAVLFLAFVLSAQAGDNVWSNHAFGGNTNYQSKATDEDLGGGNWRHHLEVRLTHGKRLLLSHMMCNSSSDTDEVLYLNAIGEVNLYHYDDDVEGSRWEWNAEYQ
jgi:hypothetical protein